MAADFLQLARDAFESSTNYIEANYQKRWEDNIRMFNSKHPSDSKYNSESYRYRSKLFRPKTRSVIRKNEAAASAAFFSHDDLFSIYPEDGPNPVQVASAEVNRALLKYRLKKTIPWYQLCIGALQDAQVMGACCSYSYWDYKEKREKVKETAVNPLTGEEVEREIENVVVLKDKPCLELVPLENLRFDPAAHWYDPVNTSPYFIHMIPMYVRDVKERMEKIDPKTGEAKWKKYEDQTIRNAKWEYDPVRQAREENREDKQEKDRPVSDWELVAVHRNFVRYEDEDYVFYTLGTEELLTDPKPIREVYWHGERPYDWGCVILETHKTIPASAVELGEPLQREANEVANSRLDNVKLVLNKRYIVKRNSQVDIQSLLRNAAGSVTQATDPKGDIVPIEFNDVTGSAYAEQDRINVDYDELLGNFSAGSVMTNRRMNETVGGMGMVSGAASQLTEYLLKTFAVTWVEKVLRRLVKLEQYYEADETILALASKEAQLYPRFGISRVTDQLLNQELLIRVEVGMGATDPNMRLSRLSAALNLAADMAMKLPADANIQEVWKEIFASIGRRDVERFFSGADPRMKALMSENAQIKKQLEDKQAEIQAKLVANKMGIESRERISKQKSEFGLVNKMIDEAGNEKDREQQAQESRKDLIVDIVKMVMDGLKDAERRSDPG